PSTVPLPISRGFPAKYSPSPTMKKWLLPYLLPLVCLCISSCKWHDPTSQERYAIVTTTNILADGVKALVRDSADVIPMMAIGVDPHLYKASQRDLDLLLGA